MTKRVHGYTQERDWSVDLMSRVRREGEGNTRELLMDDHQLGMREERVDMYMSVFLFTWKEDLACDDFIH